MTSTQMCDTMRTEREVKIMKKVLSVIGKLAVCCAVVLLLFGLGSLGSRYERQATVVHVWGDEVEAEDEQGNVWAFYAEGYERGQQVTLVMTDNETIGIYDDVIVKVKG